MNLILVRFQYFEVRCTSPMCENKYITKVIGKNNNIKNIAINKLP